MARTVRRFLSAAAVAVAGMCILPHTATAAAPYWQPAPTSGFSNRLCSANLPGPTGVVYQACIEYEVGGGVRAFVSIANNSGRAISIPATTVYWQTPDDSAKVDDTFTCKATSLSSGYRTTCLSWFPYKYQYYQTNVRITSAPFPGKGAVISPKLMSR